MIDFDKLFSGYMREWLDKNAGKITDPQALEDSAAEVYEEWCNTPEPALDGITPLEYFARITDGKKLADMFLQYLDKKGDVPNLLLDRIAESKGCSPYLIDIVRAKEGAKAMYAMNLLNELQCEEVLPLYADMIFDLDTAGGELAELAAEIMCSYVEQSAPLIISRLNGADIASKELAADVLSNYKNNEQAYALLTELFLSGINYELYAGYLGKYGDHRAIPILKEAAQTCDFVSYLEIAGAVESLGGDMDDIERDFADDPYYAKLYKAKNKGKGH